MMSIRFDSAVTHGCNSTDEPKQYRAQLQLLRFCHLISCSFNTNVSIQKFSLFIDFCRSGALSRFISASLSVIIKLSVLFEVAPLI